MAAPFRSDAGIQTTQQASWAGATGVPGMYYQTGVGMRVRKPDNTEFTIGAGGGSTTLAATYAAGASTTDSTLLLAATQGKLLLKDNATPIGTLFEMQSSGGTSFYAWNASNMNFGANRGVTTTSGNASWDFSNATGVFKTSTGSHTFGSATWGVPANLVVTGAASSTNTVGMSHQANVATGATSIAHIFGNTTDLTTGTLVSFQSAGTERFGFAWSGAVATLTGGSTITSFLASDGTGFQGNAGAAFVRNAGTATYQFTSTAFTPNGAQTLGASGTPFPSSFVSRPVITNQIIAAAASITVNPASGDYVRINLSATAITSLTVSAGQNGEEMVVEVVEDATGTRTIPTTWTNVAFAGGTYTVSAGANKHDLISFIYNSTLAKWCETGRALNMS